ncbi:MAG: tetratricopeptide repeat protein [Eubacteriales bacterium]|nr:tetratricopeptide repeat protein [Eubacteriales bacterium]
MKIRKAMCVLMLAGLLTGCANRGPSPLETARTAGISYMENGDYTAAAASFEEAYQLCDDKMPQTKTDISLYEASCYLKLENYEQTKDVCTRILGLGENADACYMRGTAFLHLGESEAARADFDQSVALDARNLQRYLNIYQQYESISQSAVGDAYLQMALQLQSEDIEEDYQKACIYYYLNDYSRAQELLSAAVEQKHAGAMLLMGQVYLAQDDSVRAYIVYQQYIEKYGETPEAYNGLVLCEIAEGSYEKAIQTAEKGLALVGEAGKRDLLYNQIVAYEKKLDFATAKAKAEQFMSLYPEDEQGKKEYDFLITR